MNFLGLKVVPIRVNPGYKLSKYLYVLNFSEIGLEVAV